MAGKKDSSPLPIMKRRPKKKMKMMPSNHWTTLQHLSKSNALLAKKKEQYYALLKQICGIVEKDWNSVEQANEIRQYLTTWLENVLKQKENLLFLRDEALKGIRCLDLLNTDALKSGAAELTERELHLQAFENVIDKFGKVVRYKGNDSSALVGHTADWTSRFFTQWAKTNKLFNNNILQLRESVKWLEETFPLLINKIDTKRKR
jgi:hypothetical protein